MTPTAGYSADAVVEALDQFGPRCCGLALRPYLELVAASEHAGYGDDAVQVMWHEVGRRFSAAVQQCQFGEFGVRERRFVYALTRRIRRGQGSFNVENQGGMHGTGARTKPHFTLLHAMLCRAPRPRFRASR